jgi:hypothetical protein
MAKGIYKTKTEKSGAEYAAIDYGGNGVTMDIPRDLYEDRGYKPRFDDLPTKEQYNLARKKSSIG